MSQNALMPEEIVHTKGTPEFRMLDKRRRIPGQPKKSFEPAQMWDRYEEIIRRVVLGQSNVEIANSLGVSAQMVSYVKNSEIVQEKIKALQTQANAETADISKRIKAIAPRALDLLEKIIIEDRIEGEKLPLKLRADHAEKLLDRAGYQPPREIRSLNLHSHYTLQELEDLKQRALNAAQASSVVALDAEFTEVSSESNEQ